MAQDIGGSLRGHIPHFHGSVVAPSVELASIPGKENRFHSAAMAMQKNGEDFQPGQVPEPDCVIVSTARQPQAIGRECQITDRPMMAGKVGDRGAVGEAPHTDVTVSAAGGEFASSAVECQAVNARGVTGKHVHWLETRGLENVNFSPKGAAGQIPPIRAEGETKNTLLCTEAESRTKRLASLPVKDSDRTHFNSLDHTVSARGSEHGAVPRERKRAVVRLVGAATQPRVQPPAQQRLPTW